MNQLFVLKTTMYHESRGERDVGSIVCLQFFCFFCISRTTHVTTSTSAKSPGKKLWRNLP